MRVSVFGLGYVGAVSCACCARDGLSVIGVDVHPDKVSLINEGKSPIVEDEVEELIQEGVRAGRLSATTDAAAAVRDSDVTLVSVGTPSRPNGGVDFTALERALTSIGEALRAKSERQLIVIRSTVLPGTTRSLLVPVLEKSSGKKSGDGFGVVYNPEFLRESSSVRDFYDPPFTLVGSDLESDALAGAALYTGVDAPIETTSIETAEMVKYVCNAFHALKVTFANEIGILGQALGVDSQAVMAIACKDTKLNISPKYLRPGFAFGGSCLPKDVRALAQKARERDLELPLVGAILSSNRVQIDRAITLVLSLKKKRIGVLGLSFKAGTDDLRESPLVLLTEALIGKGLELKVYDQNISLARLVGANKAYIEKELPHVSSLLVEELDAVIAHADVLVVGNAAPEFRELPRLCRDGQTVIDLVHISGFEGRAGVDYRGISW